MDIPRFFPPPLLKNLHPPGGGEKPCRGAQIPENPPKTPKFFAPSARFYYLFHYFLLLFCLFIMFLCTRNACFSSCIHFFRACGALFLFQTFCACVESAIAAYKFENCLGSSGFMNNYWIIDFVNNCFWTSSIFLDNNFWIIAFGRHLSFWITAFE